MQITLILTSQQIDDLKDALDTGAELYEDKMHMDKDHIYTARDRAIMTRQRDLALKLCNLIPYPPMSADIDLTL